MKALVREKEKAIALRKKGLTYKEILEKLPVAKSSLSLWFKDMPLSKEEKDVLKKRKDSNISKGRINAAAANRKLRIKREQKYFKEAKILFDTQKNNELFHTGIALYWAEGAKRSDMFHFMNSDYQMIEILLLWLEKFTTYKRSDLGFRLYLHQPFVHDDWESWWQEKIKVSASQFKKTIVKPSQFKSKKRPDSKGCVRIEVPKSTELLIKMKFFINMQVEYHTKQ